MKDNVLKKEFNKQDVQRVRNVLTGQAGERTTEGIGYTKKQEFHQEGDIWEENGRKWTIKDGIKQNITKLDKAKEAVMPLFCPSCNKIMKERLDAPIYRFFRRCHDCQAEFEMRLRIKGLWDDYQKQLDNSTIDHLIEHVNNHYFASFEETNDGWMSEAGEMQKWKGSINKDLAMKSLNETIEYLESLKK